MTARADRGSATIWVLACCALIMVIAGAATVRGAAVLARHRAESGADLAALAGAGRIGTGAPACVAAARTARDNGARLRTCQVRLDPGGRSGTVTVRVMETVRLPIFGVESIRASARAGRRPSYGMLAGAARRAPAAPQPGATRREQGWRSRSRGRNPAMSRSSR